MGKAERVLAGFLVLGVALVMSAAGGETGLIEAAREGNLQMVELLLSRGAAVDPTALWMAAGKGHVKIAEVLLDRAGCGPAEPCAEIDYRPPGGGGYTPLLVAASEGKTEVIKLLLDRGADLNARDADHLY